MQDFRNVQHYKVGWDKDELPHLYLAQLTLQKEILNRKLIIVFTIKIHQ